MGLVIAIFGPSFASAAPLEAYGRLPSLDTVRLSPDGHNIASATSTGDKRTIVIQAISSRETLLRLNFGDVKLRDIIWAGPRHVIAIASETGAIEDVTSTRLERFQAVDIDWQRKTYRPLLFGVGGALNLIFGRPDIRFSDGRPFAFVRGVAFVHDRGRVALFKVDMDAGVSSIAAIGLYDTTDYAVDANGGAIARTEWDAVRGRWSLDIWRGEWEEVGHLDAPIDTPDLLGLGRDGVAIAVGFGGTIQEVTPATVAWGKSFSVPNTERLIWDPTTLRLIGASGLVGDDETYQFFDSGDQEAWREVVTGFPGAKIDLTSFTDDHRKFVVRVDSPTEGPVYFLRDLALNSTTRLGAEYDGLAPRDIGPTRPVTYKARDGLALTGYLTLPPDRAGKALPLVVLPHGGPAARDEPGFDWWSQALASRGYAVLRVNYRGSDGFGAAFLAAGFGEWGRKMQTDLSDGVRDLAAKGVIDPARVCIVGASYGGYAALAGAALDPGVYRCAASVAGPSDLRAFVSWSKSRASDEGVGVQRYWLRYMGPAERLPEISPAAMADRIKIPILLIHGKDDTVVPFEQSRIMADALLKAGNPATFVTLAKEDHWLSHSQTRLQMLNAVVAFLETKNPPDPAP